MAEKITVRERIERRLVAVLEGVSGIGTVERWQMHGQSGADLSAVLWIDDESAEEGGTGSTPVTDAHVTVWVGLLVAQVKGDEESSAQVYSRWLGKIKEAVLADPSLVEPGTSEPLAVDVRWTAALAPPVVEDQPQFFLIVGFEVTYQEYRDNPYAGPGVTEQEV